MRAIARHVRGGAHQAVARPVAAPAASRLQHVLLLVTSAQTRPAPASMLHRHAAAPRGATMSLQALSSRAVVFAAGANVVEVKIEGMMCDGCTARVEEVLKGMQGVSKVTASLEKKNAEIEVKDPSILPSLVKAVQDLGFEAAAASK